MFLKTNAKTPTEATAIKPELYPTNASKPQNKSIGNNIKGIITRNCVALVPCVFPKALFVKSILFLLKEPAYNKKRELKPILKIAPAGNH